MRRVEISADAQKGIRYLRRWLAERSPNASKRAAETILVAARSLADFHGRGRLALEGIRELPVSFGSAGYVLQYFVESDRVVISRVFHSLERR
ncbi:type II toxin-antitoxin system RelE/ParE family toxin [Caulobacter segnis]|uniref:Plasmid stabilization system n=2 Tax=Caulobacter segnis TaxID=88688 RepID=D5VF45_CAUST|nr:type II toxin-antitoxin system RelE/ParE family toxin [Caulobacter segnis]ADG09463.1 plasmid stabilization system [Caulobacter segnis ATCC 21756]AVQ01257.1 type II toxin-antitoxin system RelE/ParE family toxin [Caulobacter segnis]